MKPCAVRNQIAITKAEITNETKIKRRSKIQQNRLIIEHCRTQSLRIAGKTINPQIIERKEKDNSKNHQCRQKNSRQQLLTFTKTTARQICQKKPHQFVPLRNQKKRIDGTV